MDYLIFYLKYNNHQSQQRITKQQPIPKTPARLKNS